MGSGPGGNYSESRNSWKSQEYSARYSVVPIEFIKDVSNSYIYNKETGYNKNNVLISIKL